MEFEIKRELNKIILENVTLFPPYLFGVMENSQVAAMIPTHKGVYDLAPDDVRRHLEVREFQELKSGDLGYSYAVIEKLEYVLVKDYKLDLHDIERLISRLCSLVRTPVFDKTQRRVLGKTIFIEINKISDILDSSNVVPIIYNSILELLCEERTIASRYHNASSTYVQHLDNSLYLAYLYKKMILSMELNGDDVSNKDGYIYKTLSKLPVYNDYIQNADVFLFTILPLSQLLDPTLGDKRVIDPGFDIRLVKLDNISTVLELEKDYLLNDIESNISDIIYDFSGMNSLIPNKNEHTLTSPLLRVYSENLEGLVNPRIVENSVLMMNNGVKLDDVSCDRKDLFVIINTVMGPYCKKIIDNKGTVSYRTNSIRDQKGGKIILMELNKREGLEEDTYIYIVSATTRKEKKVVSSMVLSLLQIHHNGRTPKLSSLTQTDDSLSVKYNVKNIHHVVTIKELDPGYRTESISGSFYLDEKEGRFRYAKKVKYENVNKEFSDAMFYIKSARRSGNVNMMKTTSIKLMDILLYSESYIYDEKTKQDAEETKKYIALRANVISELHRTLEDISKIESDFNFQDYYAKESKEVRSVGVNSFVRAAISLLGELVNQTAGLARKPFM